MADALADWMKNGKYLPDVMRDFHDQKDLFKAMHELQKPNAEPSPADEVNWIAGQCYVVDRFLWFMARRGYTLQRSRAKVPFRDLLADVKAAKYRRDSHDMALLMNQIASTEAG